jgi:hypothetical protein
MAIEPSRTGRPQLEAMSYRLHQEGQSESRGLTIRSSRNRFVPAKIMASKACHVFASTTRFGLTQALGVMTKNIAITLVMIGIALAFYWLSVWTGCGYNCQALRISAVREISAPLDFGDAEMLSMRFNESASTSSGAINLYFSSYHDARCLSDGVCASAGEANAFFLLTGARIKPQTLDLKWHGGGNPWMESVRVGNYEFVLRTLDPIPDMANPVPPTEYRATVAVRMRGRSPQQ